MMNKQDIEKQSRMLCEEDFVDTFNRLGEIAAKTAKDHGWDEQPSSVGEMIALMHSELSEALECLRKQKSICDPDEDNPAGYLRMAEHGIFLPADDHISDFTGVEAEFADVIIRIMHNAHKRGYRVAEALIAKMAYNESRPYKHGGKAF